MNHGQVTNKTKMAYKAILDACAKKEGASIIELAEIVRSAVATTRYKVLDLIASGQIVVIGGQGRYMYGAVSAGHKPGVADIYAGHSFGRCAVKSANLRAKGEGKVAPSVKAKPAKVVPIVCPTTSITARYQLQVENPAPAFFAKFPMGINPETGAPW